MLINDGVGARDKRRREDNFSCKDSAILCILDGFLLDMMIVKESKLDCGKRTLERADSGCDSACERIPKMRIHRSVPTETMLEVTSHVSE